MLNLINGLLVEIKTCAVHINESVYSFELDTDIFLWMNVLIMFDNDFQLQQFIHSSTLEQPVSRI